MIATLVACVAWALFGILLLGVGAAVFFLTCAGSVWWLMRRAEKRAQIAYLADVRWAIREE